MDPLVRLRLKPLGVWTTPWQADSLLGAMACAWARSRGQDALQRDFLNPWLAREPLFVISDAFPGDSLPAPAGLSLWWDWPAEKRKTVKKYRWMTTADFRRIQKGEQPNLEDPGISIHDRVRLRNTISRVSNTTGAGGELFEVPFSSLSKSDGGLSIFARAADAGGLQILQEALEMLGGTGYGADASVGHGGFELDGDPTLCPELDNVSRADRADGFISLSTFQPAATDPVEGFWRIFVKYGKLAPEFHSRAVFKRPQVMLAAGACFRTKCPSKPFYGAPIGPKRLLSKSARASLASQDIHPVQAAFALAVPMVWPKGTDE